jgi:hypothetical protein
MYPTTSATIADVRPLAAQAVTGATLAIPGVTVFDVTQPTAWSAVSRSGSDREQIERPPRGRRRTGYEPRLEIQGGPP